MRNLLQNIAKFIENKCAKRAETNRKKLTRNWGQQIAKAKKCHFFLKKSKKNHVTREPFRFFHSRWIPLLSFFSLQKRHCLLRSPNAPVFFTPIGFHFFSFFSLQKHDSLLRSPNHPEKRAAIRISLFF